MNSGVEAATILYMRHLNSKQFHIYIVCFSHLTVHEITRRAVVCLLPTILSQLLSISVALVKCNCTQYVGYFGRLLLWIHYNYLYFVLVCMRQCAFFRSVVPRQAFGCMSMSHFVLHMLTLSPVRWAVAINPVCNTIKMPYRITVVKCIACEFCFISIKAIKYSYRVINCHVLCWLNAYSHLEYVKVFDDLFLLLSHKN